MCVCVNQTMLLFTGISSRFVIYVEVFSFISKHPTLFLTFCHLPRMYV